MNISFTGHRDCQTTEEALEEIHREYPNATWVHGDCKTGFDAQVKAFAIQHGITQDPIPPHPQDIRRYGYKKALLLRDEVVARKSSGIVYAAYDGIRKRGGTVYTMNYAKSIGKAVKCLPCVGLK